MNSYERVMNMIKGSYIDKVPVSGTFGLVGAKLTGCPLEKYYTDVDAYIKGEEAIMDRFHPDVILTPLNVARTAEAFGCNIKYFDDAPPNIVKRSITKVSEIDSLKLPDINQHNYYKYIKTIIKELSDKFSEVVPIGAIWLDPFDLLGAIVGAELYMELMLFNREKFDQVIDKLTNFSIDCANMMLANGADLIVNFASFCNTGMITRDMARDINFSVLSKCYGQINGSIILHHGGFKIQPFIDIYKELPNLLGFVVDKADDLIEASKGIKSHQIILGNISSISLSVMTAEQISLYCDVLLKKMDGRKFILFTSAADIPFDTSEENIDALMESARKFEQNKPSVIGIACGIFEKEIMRLDSDGKLPVKFRYLDSRLHMKPSLLKEKLDSVIEECLKIYDKVLLLYGDCHPYMVDFYDAKRVIRVPGINCCNIILGKTDYRMLRKKGAFFVFHEWAYRWKEIFVEDIGLTKKLAPLFMKDMHTSIVYIDSGVGVIPYSILEDMSNYFQLPYEILEVELDELAQVIISSYNEVIKNEK